MIQASIADGFLNFELDEPGAIALHDGNGTLLNLVVIDDYGCGSMPAPDGSSFVADTQENVLAFVGSGAPAASEGALSGKIGSESMNLATSVPTVEAVDENVAAALADFRKKMAGDE